MIISANIVPLLCINLGADGLQTLTVAEESNTSPEPGDTTIESSRVTPPKRRGRKSKASASSEEKDTSSEAAVLHSSGKVKAKVRKASRKKVTVMEQETTGCHNALLYLCLF